MAPKFLSPILAGLSFFGAIFCARYSYDVFRVLIDIAPIFLATSLLPYPVTYIYKFYIVEKDKRMILGSFSRYLHPEVVKMINTKKLDASLGGENKRLSVLFSDIAGFTSISEKLDVHILFDLMSEYLSTMTNILANEHGTLDKYIGDAIMGFFGAPVDDPRHAYHACKTAVLMRRALPELQQKLLQYYDGPLDFRVGIATGEVMVGNIGSNERLNYTVLGDTVNLASRLEAIGKEYKVQMVVAASTREEIGDEFLVRELDLIAVK